ncbi:hypothetical protein F4781DRAFT_16934 [Annulohypoxylon bovei var. microspora]|nr:hypothetical protein F4781DRAFT_16934 [Annulohypoxylon bovei var. microspora]
MTVVLLSICWFSSFFYLSVLATSALFPFTRNEKEERCSMRASVQSAAFTYNCWERGISCQCQNLCRVDQFQIVDPEKMLIARATKTYTSLSTIPDCLEH